VDDRTAQPVAGGGHDLVVERHVGVQVAGRVLDLGLQGGQPLADPGSLLQGGPGRGLGGHLGLQCPPGVDQIVQDGQLGVVPDHRGQHHRVEQIPLGQRPDPGALSLLHRDQPHRLHGLDRLADHRAADREGLAQHRLGGERRVRRQLAADQPVDQFLDHRGGQSLRPLWPLGQPGGFGHGHSIVTALTPFM
jgi:hypothetical protein